MAMMTRKLARFWSIRCDSGSAASVRGFAPVASHLPERAEKLTPIVHPSPCELAGSAPDVRCG